MEHFCSTFFTIVYKVPVHIPYIEFHHNAFCKVWTTLFLLYTWSLIWVFLFFMNSSIIYIRFISQFFNTGKPLYSVLYFKWLVQKYMYCISISVWQLYLLVCNLFIITQSPNLFCLMTVKSMTSEYTSN